MKIEVEIKKKYFVAIMATLLVIAGTFFVVSYVGPNGVGHDADELDLTGVCLSNGTGCLKATYAGCTSARYRDSQIGGYSGADAKCVSEFGPGSRMCNSYDLPQILASIKEDCYGYINTYGAPCHALSLGPFTQPKYLSCDCGQWQNGGDGATVVSKWRGNINIEVEDCGGLYNLHCCKDQPQ